MANLIWKKFYHLITASESGSQVCKQYSIEPSEMDAFMKLFRLWKPLWILPLPEDGNGRPV